MMKSMQSRVSFRRVKKIFKLPRFIKFDSLLLVSAKGNKVKPVYNDHPWDLKKVSV